MNQAFLPRKHRVLRPAAVALAAALVALAASGEEEPAGRSVGAYEAEAGCPDRARFVAVVRSFLDPAERAASPPPLAVALRREGAIFAGTLRAEDGFVAREIQANTCDEAALALAYVVALAISPNAAPGKGPPSPPAASSPGAPSASAAPASATPSASAAPAASSPASSTTPAASVAPEAPAAPAPQPRSWLRLDALVSSGVAPAAAPGLRLAYERSVGPLRLGAGLVGALRDTSKARGSYRFTEAAIEPTACVIGAVGALHPGVCGLLRVGGLRASASGVDGATSATALRPGVQGRVGVPLGGRFELGASAGTLFPLIRAKFSLIGPDQKVFSVPAVAAEGGLFFSAHFL